MERDVGIEMARLGRKLWRDSRGATAIEYGLIVSLIVIAIVAGISKVGGATGNLWGNISTKATAAMPTA
jgi:pilus assembly protein Flp/PilA